MESRKIKCTNLILLLIDVIKLSRKTFDSSFNQQIKLI